VPQVPAEPLAVALAWTDTSTETEMLALILPIHVDRRGELSGDVHRLII
jgi:hypothetical protein